MSKRGFRVCYRPPGWTPPPRRDSSPATGGADTPSNAESAAAAAPPGQLQQQQQDAAWGRRRPSPLAPQPPADYAPDASMYVLAAVNRFGEAGGMATLAQRLTGGRPSFGEVLETFRVGKALRTYASSRAVKETNWTLKECAAAALLSVPPESMRAATKVEIAECVSSVRDVALTLSGGGSATANSPLVLLQELEQLELAMAMKVGMGGGGLNKVDAVWCVFRQPSRVACRCGCCCCWCMGLAVQGSESLPLSLSWGRGNAYTPLSRCFFFAVGFEYGLCCAPACPASPSPCLNTFFVRQKLNGRHISRPPHVLGLAHAGLRCRCSNCLSPVYFVTG